MNIVGVYIIIILFCALLFAVGAILLDGITTFLKPTDGVKESGLCKEYESGLSGLRYNNKLSTRDIILLLLYADDQKPIRSMKHLAVMVHMVKKALKD